MTMVMLLPDGVGVRNFLLGPFLRHLPTDERIYLLSVVPQDMRSLYVAGTSGQVQWGKLLPYPDRPLPMMLRKSLLYAHIYWADTLSMRYIRKQKVQGSRRARVADRTARFIGQAMSSSAGIQILDKIHSSVMSRTAEVNYYRGVFAKVRPSVLFCSHQRPITILPPVLAARSLGIPTATFIFSWDNLTSKGRIAAPFDHYLVWSSQMRRELLRYYPDVSPGRVHIVGTPQFDPYADCSLILPRGNFFKQVGADPDRPLICYSGNDVTTGPQEPEQLRAVMELIRDGSIKGNPQILLRPSPVDDGSRYSEVLEMYPEIIYSRPEWVHPPEDDWEQILPLPGDVRLLANLTHHADLNINTASTMTLDFVLHDKPVVNMAFDVTQPPVFGVPLWEYYYRFEHYRPVVQLKAARFARSRQELATHVNAYLENPGLDAEGRCKLAELEVGETLGCSSLRIWETLGQISRPGMWG